MILFFSIIRSKLLKIIHCVRNPTSRQN